MILPSGFVYLKDIDPTIFHDLKYASNDNFVGCRIRGYTNNVVICTLEAAMALKKVQEEIVSYGYSLKVFDAYRPQRAVEHFWEWAHDSKDIINKEKYYPSFENKVELFKGYIARYSAHSRGSTFDLTIVSPDGRHELKMGTIFDFLGRESNTDYEGITNQEKENRRMLLEAMEKHGFQNYPKEWWHYTLKNEPFPRNPEDHFDFEVA